MKLKSFGEFWIIIFKHLSKDVINIFSHIMWNTKIQQLKWNLNPLFSESNLRWSEEYIILFFYCYWTIVMPRHPLKGFSQLCRLVLILFLSILEEWKAKLTWVSFELGTLPNIWSVVWCSLYWFCQSTAHLIF